MDATFTVTLPRVAVRQVQQLERDAKSNDPAGPRRVLIIEDNDDASERLRALLEELDHEITKLSTVLSAWRNEVQPEEGQSFKCAASGSRPG